MNRRVFQLLLLAALCVSPPLAAQIGNSAQGAPAKNWETKLFTREGFPSLILRGSEVRLAAGNRYDVVDLSITIFSGKADAQVDSIVLSPLASYLSRENRASGEQAVRLIREDMEVTGEQWTYVHAEKKVTVQKNTRVVFHAALPDLLQ